MQFNFTQIETTETTSRDAAIAGALDWTISQTHHTAHPERNQRTVVRSFVRPCRDGKILTMHADDDDASALVVALVNPAIGDRISKVIDRPVPVHIHKCVLHICAPITLSVVTAQKWSPSSGSPSHSGLR